MKHNIVYIVIILFFCFFPCRDDIFCQVHRRSPQEEALKLTQMIVRELNITDSVQRDTLYRMHLKYAILRQKSNTRHENMQRMLLIDEELKSILTPEQYNRFMNNQINCLPRTCNSKRLYHHDDEQKKPQ